MPSVNKTPNYGLTQYSDNGMDRFSLMGDYNSDMKTIDLKLKALDDRINQLQNGQSNA